MTQWFEHIVIVHQDAQLVVAAIAIDSWLNECDVHTCLAESELAQWEWRSSEKAKHHYLAARYLCKHILSLYLYGAHSEWQILNNASGVPLVMHLNQASPVQLSISHSGAWVVCAVSLSGRKLGVDIESIKPRTHLYEATQTLASTAEQAWLEKHRHLIIDLYRFWVAKEALCKYRHGSIYDSRLHPPIDFDSNPFWRVVDGQKQLHIQHFDLPDTSYVGAWVMECNI